MFIAFDGPNGVGKSSIIERVKTILGNDKKIFITKEPSETEFGQYVKKNENEYLGKHYGMLIASDRQYHIDTIIKPHLNNDEIVLCDRYIASSLVLQNFDGMSKNKIWEMNKHFLIPDLYVIILANEEEVEERLQKRTQLSKFERKMSRAEEIKYFKDAINFLKKKQFNVLRLENNNGDLERNISIIVKLINEV